MSRRRDALPGAIAPSGTRAQAQRGRASQEGVRAAAARVLERTLAARAPLDPFLHAALQPFDERDQALLRELVLGSLRWLRRIDHVLAAASHRPLLEIEPELLAALRIGAYQLLFLDRVPAHAAVDEAVEHIQRQLHRGAAAFANAVLRRIARAPTLDAWPVREDDALCKLAIETSHPDFLVARWLERFGNERTRALLEANNRPKPPHLLAFRDRGGRELLAEALIDEGLEVVASPISPLGLIVRGGNPLQTEAFRRGELYLQDEASQVAALVPPPRRGERVLDAAAAPGGKTFALLAWEPEVRAAMADISLARAALLRSNLARLRRTVPLLVADAGAPALRAVYDRVVLDLPCSGTGTLRRHPELKWRLSAEEIGRLSDQALRLLHSAAPLVGAGGLLVAITCSLEREENEDVVTRFLGSSGAFRRLALEERLPEPLRRWITGPGAWRLVTGGEHDGFTVHALEREA